jgi:hypothetical protein
VELFLRISRVRETPRNVLTYIVLKLTSIGFHDSNNARVKAAEEYMYGCDEIFVVADIGRVGTNKNVEMILSKNLGSNLKNGRPSQGIALVCTKSEVLS